MEVAWSGIKIEVLPQDMKAANNYEEARQVYGEVLVSLARAYPNAELIVNVSSGTPAIKLACLMTIAEERISGEPYYADDPNESQEEQLVRRLEFTFLRESALTQRGCGLIRQGQFGLAQDPLQTLSDKASLPTQKEWARFWKQWMQTLQSWDERDYTVARQSLASLRSQWLSLPTGVQEVAKTQQYTLDKLAVTHQRGGLLAWDIYYQARRLQMQGHLTAALECLWIAIENSTCDYIKRAYGIDSSRYELRDARDFLQAKSDSAYTKLMEAKWQGKTIEQWFHPLRQMRNEAVHNGKPATAYNVHDTDELAQHWLSALSGAMPADYPMSPEALGHLASLFSTHCGL